MSIHMCVRISGAIMESGAFDNYTLQADPGVHISSIGAFWFIAMHKSFVCTCVCTCRYRPSSNTSLCILSVCCSIKTSAVCRRDISDVS